MRHKPLWALISLTILLLVLDRVSQSQANTEPPATVETTTTTVEPGEFQIDLHLATLSIFLFSIVFFFWQFCYKLWPIWQMPAQLLMLLLSWGSSHFVK